MRKEEFETLLGGEVTEEQYKAIEEVYVNLTNCTKQDFVKMFKTMPTLYNDIAKLSRLYNIAKQNVQGYKTFCNGIGERILEERRKLEFISSDVSTNMDALERIASDCMGDIARVKYKVLNGHELSDKDRRIINEVFKES